MDFDSVVRATLAASEVRFYLLDMVAPFDLAPAHLAAAHGIRSGPLLTAAGLDPVLERLAALNLAVAGAELFTMVVYSRVRPQVSNPDYDIRLTSLVRLLTDAWPDDPDRVDLFLESYLNLGVAGAADLAEHID